MSSPTLKNKPASIWSFESGYGSATLEDDEGVLINQPGSSSIYGTLPLFQQERDHLDLGDSPNLDAEDGTRSKAIINPTEPQDTILDVFTAKVCSNNESLFATQNNNHDCLRCQLWNITNPDGDLKCEDCIGEAFIASEAIIYIAEQPITTTVAPQPDILGQPPSQTLLHSKGTARCSACEISALIEPNHSTNCTSCNLNTRLSSRSLASKTSEVKRSCARRPPTKLESHATRCLQGWLQENRNNPYPDADTKRSLAEKCGMTEKQVNTWFTNARAQRRVVDTSLSNPNSEDEGSRGTRLPSVTSTAMSEGASCDHHGSVASYCLAEDSNRISTITSRRGKKKDYGRSNNIRCAAHQASPVSSVTLFTPKSDDDSETQTWQCTFCYQHIARKSWRRHEETQHRPKWKWTCLLSGPSIAFPSQSVSAMFCAFCMISNPSDVHFAQCHRIAECLSKSEDERTFLRPDHLRQHIKSFHKSRLDGTVRDLWRREGACENVVESWICGFCAKVLKTWEDRETHIAGHFKDGLTMTNWKGYAQQDIEAEASKKRPSSSEGRPSMLSKLARTLTGRSVHQSRHYESHSLVADDFDATPTCMETSGPDLLLLPELIFDDFMLGSVAGYFSHNDTTFTSAYQQDSLSAERHDSSFPDGDDIGFDFSQLADDGTNEDFSIMNTFDFGISS